MSIPGINAKNLENQINKTNVNTSLFENGLENYLMKTPTGRDVLKRKEKLKPQDRRTITILIVDYLFRHYSHNNIISSQIFLKSVEEIIALFPKENAEVYYVPPKPKTATTPHVQAFGKLCNRYYNLKKHRKSLSSPAVDEVDLAEKILTPSPVETQSSPAYQYVRKNMKINAEFMTCWKQTLIERKIHMDKCGVQKYFEEITAFVGSDGYRLFLNDFDAIYSEASNKLFDKWRDLSKKIVHLCVTQGVIPELDYSDYRDVLAVTFLPLLIHRTLNKKNSTDDSTVTKRRISIQQSFFLTATDAEDVKKKTQEKLEEQKKCNILQPYLIGIKGSETYEITETYVAVGTAVYCTNSVPHALDMCFKIFHALNVPYPNDCKLIWLFLQKYIYEIKSVQDKAYTRIESLITDLNYIGQVT